MSSAASSPAGRRAWSCAPGTPVVINPYLSCGHCVACRKGKPNCCATLKVLGVHIDGGMCERILVPEENLYPAGNLSLRDAAMIEFQAIGAHAVRRAGIEKGDRVLVVGAGPIGVGTGVFARLAGGDVTLMDISERRLAFLADRLGFHDAIVAGEGALAEIDRRTGGDRYDVVLDATGKRQGDGSVLRLRRERRHAGLRRGPQRRHHLLRPRVPPQGDDAEGDAERHPRRLRHGDGGDRAGHVPMDALNTHSGTLDELPEIMPAWMHRARAAAQGGGHGLIR